MNVKIFAAPLLNRVHLVTILVVAILFGAFRLSGGGAGLKSKQLSRERADRAPLEVEAPTRSTARVTAPIAADDILGIENEGDLFNPQAHVRRLTGGETEGRPAAPVKPPTRAASDSTESLDDLVDVRGVGESPAKRPKNTGGLNDIEKLVGLR